MDIDLTEKLQYSKVANCLQCGTSIRLHLYSFMEAGKFHLGYHGLCRECNKVLVDPLVHYRYVVDEETVQLIAS